MKRRLTKAYDAMTMPDRCSNTIERKLTEHLQQQKNGNYTRIVPAAPVRRRGWMAGVAAVCLMLVLSVGGSLLYLYSSEMKLERPENLNPSLAEPIVISAATPEDHYAVVTNFSAEKVEAFAKVVRHNMLERNWKALEGKISFPLAVQDWQIQNNQEFVEWIDAFFMYSVFRNRLEQESCEAMFCNWQGICMADGFIWINEVDGELKITALNRDVEPVTVTDTPVKQVPEVFAEVLAGKAVYFYGGNYGPRTLEEYCTGLWGEVTVDRFAVVDMDADGTCEVVASVQSADTESRVHLVLRQDGKYICGYSFRPGEMKELKKDGSFGYATGRPNSGIFRMIFEGADGYQILEVLGERAENEFPPAQWHAYPCIRPELVLESYEYVTGTGQSLFPGIPYSYFELLVHGRTANDWEMLKPILFRTGREEAETVYIYDADAPGTCVYGTLTEVNGFKQFDTLGFYISNEYGEQQAEVRKLHTEDPEYLVGTHLEKIDSHGWQVQTPEELIAEFGFTPMPDGRIRKDTNDIKALIGSFANAWLTGDTRTMEIWLSDDYQGSVEGFALDWDLELMNYGALPTEVMDVGDRFQVNAGLRQSGIYHGLTLDLVKQKDGWKVLSYRFDPSEE